MERSEYFALSFVKDFKEPSNPRGDFTVLTCLKYSEMQRMNDWLTNARLFTVKP